ncbi:hypothetical protein [Vreelandella gomseomensis]|uniref:Uncharacterized protein n=1 Tax=Vreelandella gomseomensis TaxID=370766 RepID=A0ABU1GGE6_9GAMM|nr:hypothetical protein [Halomonas gomseomensis]MDR5876546.1 hypothetical protein [Halomonas gomseomensis]
MDTIRQLMMGFPFILFSVLLPLVGLYWLLVLLRIAPVELFEKDSLRDDHLASALVALGFAGVPTTVALSWLIVLAAGMTLAVELLVLRWLSVGLFIIPIGVVLLWASFAVASPIAETLCRQMGPWFHRHQARRSLLGKCVKVVQAPSDGQPGRAVLTDDSSCEVRLLGKQDRRESEGEYRVLVKYLPGEDAFRSVAKDAFLETRTRLRQLNGKSKKSRSEGTLAPH